MTTGKIKDMKRGWCIGNFEPSVFKTAAFEMAILLHPQGERWPAHYHRVATEYNFLLTGSMRVCDTELTAGDWFVIEPMEVADPVFHEDCQIVCIKVPSDVTDKHLI